MTDMHTAGSDLLLSDTNLGDLFDLVHQAKKEAEQLEQTLNQLLTFEATVSISVHRSTYISPVIEKPT